MFGFLTTRLSRQLLQLKVSNLERDVQTKSELIKVYLHKELEDKEQTDALRNRIVELQEQNEKLITKQTSFKDIADKLRVVIEGFSSDLKEVLAEFPEDK